MTLDDLLKLPEDLIERAWRAVEERRRAKYVKDADAVAGRIEKANQGHGDFKEDELVYAAGERCACGAGMAYPNGIGMHGAWECSAILKGQASRDVKHSEPMPFAYWSVKSEKQPSAHGQTTRP